jgi:hypothetical protein
MRCSDWIYNYLCNQCLSPLMLWVRISIRARCTTLCDKICQWLATDRWFFPGPPVSTTTKTGHDITVILLKVALNTIEQTEYITTMTFLASHQLQSHSHVYILFCVLFRNRRHNTTYDIITSVVPIVWK